MIYNELAVRIASTTPTLCYVLLLSSSHLSCGSEKLVKRAVKQLFCGVKPTFNNHRRYRAAAILRRRKTIETVLKRGGFMYKYHHQSGFASRKECQN